MLQWGVHIVVVREIHTRIRLARRFVESMVEYDQRRPHTHSLDGDQEVMGSTLHSTMASSELKEICMKYIIER